MEELANYDASQDETSRAICERLRAIISAALPTSTAKIWHGSPVWFLDGNPVVGYAVRKDSVQLLFWSGQSFDEPMLHPEGSFKAAEIRYQTADEIDESLLHRWLDKAGAIQWDYKNIVRNKGRLERL